MSNISDLLDIFLITYNRAPQLERTLEQILSADSPIKNFEITVIDNDSTDSTADVVKKYQTNFPNLQYKKNKYNIGGNGNIARTYELGEKKYIWILCDNDFYDWEAWGEVEKAIEEDKDSIMVVNYHFPHLDYAQYFIQASFVPASIYKKSIIDNFVIQNMQFNISNMFPHLAIAAKIINENLDVHIVEQSIVVNGCNDTGDKTDKQGYLRGLDKSSIHPLMKQMSWLPGYANSIQMINNKKIRNYIASHSLFFLPPLTSAFFFFNNRDESNGSLYNICCVFCLLDFWGKIKFIFNLFAYYTIYRIIYIYAIHRFSENSVHFDKNYVYRQYKVILFGLLKTNLFKIKVKLKRKK